MKFAAPFIKMRLLFAALFVGSGLLLGFISFAGVASKNAARLATSATGKIAPWVVEQTSEGKQAEFLVVLADQADLRGARSLESKKAKGRYVRDALWQKAQRTQAPLLEWLRANGIEHRAYYIVNMIWVKAGFEVANAIASRADVLRVEGNPRIRNHNLPAPNESSTTPAPEAAEAIEQGINYTRAPEVWSLGFTGQGVIVGGADTGYRWDHDALKTKYAGWNGSSANHDYAWHDSIHSGGGSCGANSPAPCDDDGHGTHTMGTAVGDDGGSNQIGMAPGAKWIGCRNMDQGVGAPSTYIECFEFFLAPYPVGGTPAQGDPSKAPDVTNNSWACPPEEGCSAETLHAALQAQRAAGIMTVAAAGNEGSGCSTVADPIAIYDETYSIGALNNGTDTIAYFSSRGPVTIDGSSRPKPDLSAPGTNVRSASRSSTSSYVSLNGTSMASPHVAGAVALLWSADPTLKNDLDATERLLNTSSVSILSNGCVGGAATSPNNVYGYGRLDVKAAVAGAFLNVLSVRRQSSDFVVSFQAIAGETYRLEAMSDMSANSWADVASVDDITAATTGPQQFVNPGEASATQGFYRVRLIH